MRINDPGRQTVSLVAVLGLLAAGCLCTGGTEPAPRSLVQRVFQSHLSDATTDVNVDTRSLFTTVVSGRFECPKADLAAFLEESRLLPDDLETGSNPLAATKLERPWWHPESLSDPSGTECAWETEDSVVTCRLATGSSGEKKTTVYFLVVYEGKESTGMRSDVHADPNWEE